MSEKPEVGFQFGVEGDQSLLATVRALREELKNVQKQQESTASSAEVLQRAWSGLVQLAAVLKLAQFARDVFDTAVAIGKLSEITGIGTQTLSVYYKAATDVGVAHEAVDKGLAKLSRSLVMLQAGNASAAQGFRILHLSAKDFIGLSPDQKIQKVTDAFAGMAPSAEKATAAQLLMGRAGQQLIPVLDQLGGEDFAKLAEQVQRLGLSFGPEFVAAARRAKADLEDLKGTAEGATAQFETGFIPALDDAARAMVASTTGGGNAFKTLGEYAGNALKFILNLIAAFGIDISSLAMTVVEWVSFEFENLKIRGGAAFAALERSAHLDFSGALRAFQDGMRDAERAHENASGRIGAIWEAAAKKQRETYDTLWSGLGRQAPKDKPSGEPGDIKGAQLNKGMGRAEASGLKQQAQDELALHKALTQQELEEDKRAYDQGLLSLTNYFDRRRGAIQQGFVEEAKTLGAEKLGLQGLLAKAEAQGGKTPQQELANQKEILGLKQQIAHVDSQLAIELTKRDTELDKNETERAKAKQDHLLKELGEQKKLADLEGDRAKSAQLAIQIEDMQIRHELEQLGKTKAEIDAFMAQYGAARGIRTTATDTQKGFEGGESGLAEKKAALQEKVADYQLQPYQAERQLHDEYAKEIPILEAKVQLLRQQAAAAQALADQHLKELEAQKQAADAQGDTALSAQLSSQIASEKGPNGEAVDLTKQADQDETKLIRLRTEMTKMDTTWMSWRTTAFHSIDEVSTHLTTGLNGWIQGHQRFGDAMKQMWNGMVMIGVNALEKMAAQWIAHHLRMLLVKVITNQMGVASDATAATEGAAIDAASTQQRLRHYAALAAGKAWSALAQIPVVGPILGAIAAAVTYVGVMALGGFAQGGYVGRGAPRTLSFAGGGQMIAQSMLGGGFLRGPGSSTSDSIPAMLSDREYVVSAKGVSNIGVETLDAINKGAFRGAFLPPIRHPAPYTANGFRMASGGLAKSLGSSGASNSGHTFNLSPTIQSSSIDSKDFRDHIDDHMDYIADGLKQRMRNFRF